MDIRIIALCTVVALSTSCGLFKKHRHSAPASASAAQAKVEQKAADVPGATLPAHPSKEPQVVQLDNGKFIVVSDFLKGRKNLCGAVKAIEIASEVEEVAISSDLGDTPKPGTLAYAIHMKAKERAGRRGVVKMQKLQSGLCVQFPCGVIEFDVMNKLGAEGKLEAMSKKDLITLNKSLSTVSNYLKLNYGHNFNTCTIVSRNKEETPIILDDVLAFQERVNVEYFKKLSK